MKKLYIASSLVALMLAGASCSNNYDIYPEQYDKVIMIKDAGAKTMTVYSTDTKAPYQMTILKGGVSAGKAVTATLRAMTSEEFSDYLAESGRPYSMLPADCFSFTADGQTSSMEIQFGADETYKTVAVYINAANFGTYMEGYESSIYRPTLPVVLESNDASINSEGSETFIIPSYVEPSLDLESTGLVELDRSGNTMSFEVSLPIENQWDINFKVALDPDYVDAYNAANATSYTCASADAVSGLQDSYTLAKGQRSIKISFNLDPTKLAYTDVVPVKIYDCSVPGIVIDPDANAFIAPVKRRINITVGMLSTNALEPSEGSLANLLDGDPATFFHSAWSVSVAGTHWLQVALPDAYSTVQIEYWNRISGSTNTPAWFNLYTGTSEDNLTLFKAYSWDGDGLKGGSGEKNILAPIYFDAPQSVFRIENTGSWNGNVFFVMTEFRMYTI